MSGAAKPPKAKELTSADLRYAEIAANAKTVRCARVGRYVVVLSDWSSHKFRDGRTWAVMAQNVTAAQRYGSRGHVSQIVRYATKWEALCAWADLVTSTYDRAESLKATAAAKRAAHLPNPFVVGSVLCGSWGYEQTQAEFWRVVAVSGAMVSIRQCNMEGQSAGRDTGRCWPADGERGEALRRRVVDGRVKLHESCNLYAWTPEHGSLSWSSYH